MSDTPSATMAAITGEAAVARPENSTRLTVRTLTLTRVVHTIGPGVLMSPTGEAGRGPESESSHVIVDRFTCMSAWADLVRKRFVAFDIGLHGASDPVGVVRTRRLGHLQTSVASSVPQTVTRNQAMASAGPQVFVLGMVDRGVAHFEQDGRTCTVNPGEFLLYETCRPLTLAFTRDWQFRAYMWPREAIRLTESESRTLTLAVVQRTVGMGRFLGPMLDDLIGNDPDLSWEGATRLAGEVAELAIIAAGEVNRHERQADPADAELRPVQMFIEERLTDPTLSPAGIAQEFFMSTRTLHRMFARHGLTVAAWIKHRRLEACRRALVSPRLATAPISEIAAQFGFSSLQFFSREFAATYGVSPSGYRVQHAVLNPADMPEVPTP